MASEISLIDYGFSLFFLPCQGGQQSQCKSRLIKVLHEAIFLSISSISFIFFSHNQNMFNDKSMQKILCHPFSLCIACLCLWIVMKGPGYLWSFLSIAIIGTIILFLKGPSLSISDNQEELLCALVLGLLNVGCLVEEGYISISWQAVMIVPTILLFLILGLMSRLFYQSYKCQKRNNYLVYSHSFWRKIFAIIFIDTILLNLIAQALTLYIPQPLSNGLLFGVFLLTFITGMVLYLFMEQTLLLAICPYYNQQETMFQIHQRCFFNGFNPKICQRDQLWSRETCLLCESLADVVCQGCGHLNFCFNCTFKMKKKQLFRCLICGQDRQRYRQLFSLNVREGYQRKIFIQKKLWGNQRLCRQV